jgi:hypothetical protein
MKCRSFLLFLFLLYREKGGENLTGIDTIIFGFAAEQLVPDQSAGLEVKIKVVTLSVRGASVVQPEVVHTISSNVGVS